MMKSKPCLGAVCALALLALSSVFAMPPRTDINPALFYLQAFNLFPPLDQVESTLLGREISGDPSEDERALAKRFDSAFIYIVRAFSLKGMCDWGIDPADGPKAVVPNLIKIRTAVHAAYLRARVALADGKPERVRDELLAVSVMSRHAANGSLLVSTMVQFAAELKLLNFLATHFDELPPPILAEISTGMQGAPRRASVADAVFVEKEMFYDWVLDKLDGLGAPGGDDRRILEQFRTVVADVLSGERGLGERIIDAAGGTGAGVVRYVNGVEPYYNRSMALARASGPELKLATAELEAALSAATNLLARAVIPNIGKARLKELEFQMRLGRLPNAAP